MNRRSFLKRAGTVAAALTIGVVHPTIARALKVCSPFDPTCSGNVFGHCEHVCLQKTSNRRCESDRQCETGKSYWGEYLEVDCAEPWITCGSRWVPLGVCCP